MENKVYSSNGYKIIEMNFKDKDDLINYLKTALTSKNFVNYELVSHEINERNAEWTKTKSYDEAMKFFEYGWHEDFNNFLSQKKKIDKYFPYISQNRIYQNNVYGNFPNVVNAIRNNPLNMKKIYLDKKYDNIISIYFNCAYPWFMSKEQIFNNGLITIALIDFLESTGHRVDLKFYELTKLGNEIFYIDMFIKKMGEKINLQNLYFPFCNPSFLRRILFRVLETNNSLSYHWKTNYGFCMKLDELKNILNLDNNLICINSPNEMHVEGKQILEDIKNYLDIICLNKYIKPDLNKYSIYDRNNILSKK